METIPTTQYFFKARSGIMYSIDGKQESNILLHIPDYSLIVQREADSYLIEKETE